MSILGNYTYGRENATTSCNIGRFAHFVILNPDPLDPHNRNSLGYLKKLKFIISRRAVQFGLIVLCNMEVILPVNSAGHVVFSDFFAVELSDPCRQCLLGVLPKLRIQFCRKSKIHMESCVDDH